MRIVIPGDPIAKARHRLSTVNGFAMQYDPQKKQVDVLKRKLVELSSQIEFDEYNDSYMPALSVSLSYHMPIAVSESKAIKNAKLWGLLKPNHKPDLDNLVKFTLDASNGILWHDDAQIIELSANEKYSKTPCTIIQVEIIPEIKMTKEHETVFKTFSPDDIADLHSHIGRIQNALYPSYRAHEEPGQSQLAAAADLLIKFANTWTDKLKKIKGK